MVFEIVLLPPQARGLKDGRTEVKVKMRNLDNGYSWMWSRNQFLERKYRMQEMYQNYVEGEQWDLPQVGWSCDNHVIVTRYTLYYCRRMIHSGSLLMSMCKLDQYTSICKA